MRVKVEMLDTGYWHARISLNQFVQWPVGRLATLQDAFGWVTQQQVDEINAATAGLRAQP